LEDARHSSVLYICKYFVLSIILEPQEEEEIEITTTRTTRTYELQGGGKPGGGEVTVTR
jgi:hypothetical protein